MMFSDKIKLFRQSTLAADIELSATELDSIGASTARFLSHQLFEAHARLACGAPTRTARLLIGTHSYMNEGGYFRGRIILGRYVSIGRRVTIGAGNHFITGLSSSPSLNGGPPERNYTDLEIEKLGTIRLTQADRPVVIGHDVWIGDGAIIMPGRKIGTGAVIGANAVVNRDIPPYAIVGGVPVRILRYRFPEDVVTQLLATEWWELAHATLQKLPLGNVLELLPALRDCQVTDLIPTYSVSG